MSSSLLDTANLSVFTRPAERKRAEPMRTYGDVEIKDEARFKRITQLAAEYFKVPMAYVAFFEGDRQWVKTRVGTLPAETSRQLALCQHTLNKDEPLVINDCLEHPIASSHPMVAGAPNLRFYAAMPLTGPRGQKVGTFVLLDTKPRDFGPEQVDRLSDPEATQGTGSPASF